MDRVALDRDTSSLSLKHRLRPAVPTRLIGKQPYITFVTLGSWTQWAELPQWGRRNRDALEAWLGSVLPCSDSEAAPAWHAHAKCGVVAGRETHHGTRNARA
jgi:toxin FitB